jgi:hypothetical protein
MARRKKKRTASEAFDAAEASGLVPLAQSDTHGEKVPKMLEPCTEDTYRQRIDFWNEYVSGGPLSSVTGPSNKLRGTSPAFLC